MKPDALLVKANERRSSDGKFRIKPTILDPLRLRQCSIPDDAISPENPGAKNFRVVFPLEIITKSGNGLPRVIENFTCKETSKVFRGECSRKLPGDIQPRALMRLRQLHRIIAIDQLRHPPSNHLESLSGNLKGFWSIRINQQWRIVFRWNDGNAADVQINDYH